MSNPYAYEYIPPIGRLLDAICAHCGVGGTIRPRNRTLADWAGYASAGHIADLLVQLACDGRILYDRTTGLITLLFDPETDQLIPDGIDSDQDADSALIPSVDRFLAQQDAEYQSDPLWDQNAQCMEDSCLAAAESESAAARFKIPCTAESIPPPDQSAAILLAELGTNATLRKKALEARPDLTPAQVRATWAHFEARIAAGRCTAAAFHAAIANGELHAAPPDPARPLDPQSYASDPAIMLGSQAPPGEACPESIGDIARRLLPADAPGADWMFVQTRLARGDTEAGALAALAERRRR